MVTGVSVAGMLVLVSVALADAMAVEVAVDVTWLVAVMVGVVVGSQGTITRRSARVWLDPPLALVPTAHRLILESGSLAITRRALDVEPGLSEKICVQAVPSQCSPSVCAEPPVSS
jgi:hypothetical protein